MSAVKRIAVLALFAAVAWTCAVTAAKEKPPETWDGLNRVDTKKVGLLYKAPQADFGGYSKFSIDPVIVEFSKNWKPERGSVHKIDRVDRDGIKKGVAELFQQVLTEELQGKGGYAIVTEPGPDVLRLSPAIADLYINAPDTNYAGRSTTYTVSAGEMTLVMELRDSETGDLLARVIDKQASRDSEWLMWTNKVTNTAEAKQIMTKWAKLLREGLDNARATKPQQ